MTRKKSPARNKAANAPKTTAKQKKPSHRCLSDFLPLLPAEQKLLDAVAIGEMCWLCDQENPVRPEQKTKDNEIRATFIRFLALGGDEDVFVHEMGVQVAGAFVSERFELINCKNVRSLMIQCSTFENSLNLIQTKIEYLDLSFSSFPSFHGDGIQIKDNLNFINIKTLGHIRLINAQIDGSFTCIGAALTADIKSPQAMICDRITVLGDVQLSNQFKAKGEVSLRNANILGDFICQGGKFFAMGDEKKALSCDGMHTHGKILLSNNFRADGEVRFISAKVGGDFICETGQCYNLNKIAFFCDQINIEGSLFLRKQCIIKGLISFIGARIKGIVDCQSSHFQNQNNITLDFETAQIGSDVLLSNNFQAQGQVRFKNASIDGNFKFEEDSSIENVGKTALHCEGISVGGNVLLRQSEDSSGKLQINGKTNFMDARIGKGFDCSFAELTHLQPESEGSSIAGYALNLQGADIGGALTLRHNDIYGSLCLLKTRAATLNDRVESWPQPAIVQRIGLFQKFKTFLSPLWHWDFSNKQGASSRKPTAPRTSEDEGALQGVESDDTENPAQPISKTQTASSAGLSSVIALDGFSYNQIAGGSPTDAATRLKWLKLQRPSALWEKFRPQPFEQITKVLRQTGYEEDATQLLILKYDHKQDVRIERAKGFFGNIWAWVMSSFFWLFLGRATGYGKRPARLLGLLIFLWGSAAFWYSQAAQQDVFAPSHPLIFLKYDEKPDCQKNWVNCIKNANDKHNPELQAYTVFSPYLYSFDVMIPILNLHQEGDWGPKMKSVKIAGYQTYNWLTWCVMWSQIILGWLGSFMLIAMLSGWLQKE